MKLIEKIVSKEAVIAVIGLGYVGLPLIREFLKEGLCVYGFDIDARKVDLLMSGESYINHLNPLTVKSWLNESRFQATTDFSKLADVDVIIICVPTPLNEYREPDLSYVFDSTKAISGYLRKEQLIVLESTTYPGTTDEEMRNILETTGLKAGSDFYLAFSPEREDPANQDYSTKTIPKIIGGYTENCLKVAKALYDLIIEKTVCLSSTRAAEATKLLENIYRAVNIALVNEMKMIFDKMDIDIWEVIKAASTKPFGFHTFFPGPGLGGHCIPIDPFYLTWKARKYGFSTRFIELAGEINTNMPTYVVHKLGEIFNQQCKTIKNSRILILGIAYKKDIDDLRESPALKIIKLLKEKGAIIDYNDPYISKYKVKDSFGSTEMTSIELTESNLQWFDAVLLITDHTNYDYEYLEKYSNCILDTRNAFGEREIKSKKIYKC